jgi:ADP-ribose pyrophosphatase YjhB (NUDIX family)
MSGATVTALDVYGGATEVDVKKLSWRPSVYGIVIEDGKILLSPQFKGKFDLPGGGVDLGEGLEQAVVREVKEETGIDVEVIKLVGIKSSIFAASHSEGNVYHSILIYYLCRKTGGELSTEGFDEYEKQYADIAQWVPTAELDSLELASTVDYKDLVKGCL